MTYALNADIAQFNVESRAELEQLSEVATKQGKTAGFHSVLIPILMRERMRKIYRQG